MILWFSTVCLPLSCWTWRRNLKPRSFWVLCAVQNSEKGTSDIKADIAHKPLWHKIAGVLSKLSAFHIWIAWIQRKMDCPFCINIFLNTEFHVAVQAAELGDELWQYNKCKWSSWLDFLWCCGMMRQFIIVLECGVEFSLVFCSFCSLKVVTVSQKI